MRTGYKTHTANFAKAIAAALRRHGYEQTWPFRDPEIAGAWVVSVQRKPPPPKLDYAGRPMRRDWTMSDLHVGTLLITPQGEVRCEDAWGDTCNPQDLERINRAVKEAFG